MKKRIFSLLLCTVLLLGMILIAPAEAAAVSNLECSEDGIAILKKLEGFSKYPYADGGQYTVGYGSGCPSEDLERYRKNGISETEADTLLREYLEKMEASLNSFADKNGLSFSQQKFDALLLFTYNVGTGWLSETSDLRTAVLKGATGNEFLYYFTRWCTSDSEINKGLVERRLAEADLYLNGNYSAGAPSYYSYVLLDANGGECESGIQGYDASETAKVRVTPTQDGYKFLGWYTAREGGRKVTDLDTTTAGKTLYARWQGSDSQGEAANYQRTVSKDTSIYQMDGSGKVVGTLKAGETVTITKDYIDASGTQWGETAKGWIKLEDTHQALAKAEKPTKVNVTVTVTGDYVNVRKGPGTSYAIAGKVYYGDRLVISETATVNNALWGKFSGGWLSLQYTNYNAVKDDTATDAGDSSSAVIATGTVVDCDSLRIRSGPGTGYTQVGSLAVGTYVEITQRKTTGGMEWGKISNGWICLTYVQLDEKTSDPTTPPAEGTTPDTDGSTENKGQSGTVVNCQLLNVRSGPGTHNARVTTLARGTKVTILETAVYNNQPWGKIQQGWVSLAYIQLDYNSTEMGDGDGVKGTVYNCTKLNVRRAPGTNNTPVGYLLPGNVVNIYEETTVGNMHWGRIDTGWVCMDYIKLDRTGSAADGVTDKENATESTEPTQIRTGVVTGTNALRVRSGAGTQNAHVGTLNMGTVVVIHEQTTVNGVAWGRIEQGWICMAYVKLDAEDGSFSGTVNTNGLKIRSGAGVTNQILGTYDKGTRVTILETTSVKGVAWGRTDKGWICLNYVNR